MGEKLEPTQDLLEKLGPLFWYGQVGRCVSSVTHDVNNYLGGIMAYAELLEMSDHLDPETRRMASQITDATRKCSALLGALTSVARKARTDARLVEIDTFINEVLDLKRYDFRVARVALETQFDQPVPSMMIDRPKMAMALIHLLMNALDVVAQTPGAATWVRTRNNPDSLDIEIQNSGPVIPEELREQMFSLMYTTKGAEHMGMGLAMARDIAQHHGGNLTYNPDRGFVITIPHETHLALT